MLLFPVVSAGLAVRLAVTSAPLVSTTLIVGDSVPRDDLRDQRPLGVSVPHIAHIPRIVFGPRMLNVDSHKATSIRPLLRSRNVRQVNRLGVDATFLLHSE